MSEIRALRGFSLPVVYAIWILLISTLYWPTRKVAALKSKGRGDRTAIPFFQLAPRTPRLRVNNFTGAAKLNHFVGSPRSVARLPCFQ